MSAIIDGTVLPWLLGGLGLFTLFTLLKTIKSWRALKRSPYFFMRRQAAQSLRMYFWLTVGLAAMLGTLAFYPAAPPIDTTPRFAMIANAKPVAATVTEPLVESDTPFVINLAENSSPTVFEVSSQQPVEVAAPVVAEISREPGITEAVESLGTGRLVQEAQLPPEFDQLEPTAELTAASNFSPLVFSLDIDDNFEPVNPRRIYGVGFYTVYATFQYEGMADGMEWAWVWRHNGQIVNGGNELWNYGDAGPGWIYYAPPEGFQEGEYTVEIWVNGELFGQSSISMEAGVANQ